MLYKTLRKLACLILITTWLPSVQAMDKLTIEAKPLAEDSRPIRYLKPAVLNGYESTSDGSLRTFTVFLEILNADKSKVIGHCTGIILDIDIILSAGHCLAENGLFVRVNYGLGGKYGFTHREMALRYRSIYPAKYNNTQAPVQSENDDYYTFDEGSRNSFESAIKERKSLLNFVGNSIVNPANFADYAIIQVPKIPDGYQKIPLFQGDLSFRQKVLMVGYGTNTRVKSANVRQLRWSKGELVGHYTIQGKQSEGFQIYSPTQQQACYGDSGGPLLIKMPDGEYRLLGVLLFVYNTCANSIWYLNPGYVLDQINEAIAEMRATFSI